jgi:hypothetical protein
MIRIATLALIGALVSSCGGGAPADTTSQDIEAETLDARDVQETMASDDGTVTPDLPLDAPADVTDDGGDMDAHGPDVSDVPDADVSDLMEDLVNDAPTDIVDASDPCEDFVCPETTTSTCSEDLLTHYLSGASCDASTGAPMCVWEIEQVVDCTTDGNVCIDGTCVWPESTLLGSAIVSDQEDITALEAFTTIEGNLVVVDSDIENLALPHLHTITGSLLIKENTDLQSINLPELSTTGGLVYIWKNVSLWGIALPKLKEASSNVVFKDNDLVTQLSLPALEQVGGSLNINGNGALQELGLASLNETGVNLEIYNNMYLHTVSAASLVTIGGGFSVRNQSALQNIELSTLTTVMGDVRFSNLSSLGELPFASLQNIVGDLLVKNLPLLNVVEINQLMSIGGSLGLTELVLVSEVNLPMMTTIGGAFATQDLPNLGTINAPILEVVQGTLILSACDVLQQLSLPELSLVSESILMRNNDALEGVSLPALTDVGAGLFMESNPALTLLNVDQLATVNGPAMFGDNAALASLDFPALTQVTGSLVVNANAGLVSLLAPVLGSLGLTTDWTYPKPVISSILVDAGNLISSVTIIEDERIFTVSDTTWLGLVTLNSLDNEDLSALVAEDCTLGTAELHLEIWIEDLDYILTTFELTIENNNYGIMNVVGDPPGGWVVGWNIWDIALDSSWYKCSGTCTGFCDIDWSSMHRLELYRSGSQTGTIPAEIGLRNIQVRSYDLGNVLGGKNLAIVGNGQLENLNLTALTGLQTVSFTSNTLLAQCLIDAMSGDLLAEAGAMESDKNNEDCTCSETPPVVATCTPPEDPEAPD